MRKWKKYNCKIKSVDELMNCLNRFDGIWNNCIPPGRYEHSGWVVSYQLRHILNMIEHGYLWWPQLEKKQ